jgi:hypothetical protein
VDLKFLKRTNVKLQTALSHMTGKNAHMSF